MAGLEVVVRPMIFPGIRPAPRPSVVPAEADPEKGLVVIRGASGKTIDLPYSFSASFTVTYAPKEKQRKVDLARVYQKTPQGEVNRDNYVDIEAANRITMQQTGGKVDYLYQPIQASDNVEILRKNIVKQAKDS